MQNAPHDEFRQDVNSLARIVLRYVKSAVLEQSLWLSGELREARARRRAVLSTTSRFCLYAGQQQLAILSEKEGVEATRAFEKLANELNNLGGFLNAVLDDLNGVDPPPHSTVVEIGVLVQKAWEELSQMLKIPANILESQGKCNVKGLHDDLLYVVYKLLQWFAERLSNEEARIYVNCSTNHERSQITFEDSSPRLPRTLREQLFDPFGEHLKELDVAAEHDRSTEHLPLYLAKVLVEFRHHGSVLDASDDKPGNRGHKFVLSFPASVEIANPQ